MLVSGGLMWPSEKSAITMYRIIHSIVSRVIKPTSQLPLLLAEAVSPPIRRPQRVSLGY